VARARRKPLILDSHELPLVQPQLTRWRRLHALAVRVLRVLIMRCTAVITVSPPIVEEMQRLYGGPRATVVRNVPRFAPPVSSNRLREALHLPPETKIALYQGHLQANRTLHILVEAARYLMPHTVIVMMGRGPLRDRLETMIREQGVGDRVQLLPAVPYAELLEWTGSADLGLTVFAPDYSPSIYMCLPNKLFEYLMAGLPVLTSRMVAVADVVSQYEAGQVVSSVDPATVARAINAMLADEAGLARMRQNALMAARHDLNWEVEQQRLLDLYRILRAPQRHVSSARLRSAAESMAEGR
jgi:glycosyltransferase involved in cell wall biosynthesis